LIDEAADVAENAERAELRALVRDALSGLGPSNGRSSSYRSVTA